VPCLRLVKSPSLEGWGIYSVPIQTKVGFGYIALCRPGPNACAFCVMGYVGIKFLKVNCADRCTSREI